MRLAFYYISSKGLCSTGHCPGTYGLWMSLACFGSEITKIACTLLGSGFMPVLVRIYSRYSVSRAQNFDCNLVRSNPKCSRWLSWLALVMHSKPSK